MPCIDTASKNQATQRATSRFNSTDIRNQVIVHGAEE